FSAVDAAPLLCAGVIGYRALRLSAVPPGGRLGLFGFGASAHLALQVARGWNCRVYAFTREAIHRDLAFRMGAEWAGDTADAPGVPVGGAATCAPSGGVVAAALRRLARGATVAVNAIHASPLPSIPYHDLEGERAIRSVTNFTREDAEEFLELAARLPVRARV